MSHMFSGCTSLEELDLSGISISETCLVDDMFCFGTENKIKIFKTPKSIGQEIAITTGSTLFDSSTGEAKTSITTSDAGKMLASSDSGYLFEDWRDNLGNINTDSLQSIMFLTKNSLQSDYSDYSSTGTIFTTGIELYQNGESNIALVRNGTIYAPRSCYNMFSFPAVEEIVFDNFNTSYTTDMSGMFNGDESLIDLDLSGFDTSNVTTMGGMFIICTALTSINLSGFDTSNVTDMAFMFYDCHSLVSLDLSNFDTSSVTDMDSMFSGCRSLTSLDVSSFNTSKVTDFSSMFSWCGQLTSLDVTNFDTSSATSMGNNSDSYEGMFSNCSSLTSLNLSNFDTSNVTNMLYMFEACHSLEVLDLSGFTINSTTRTDGMLRLRTNNKIKVLKTPKSVGVEIPITTGSTLIDMSDGTTKTSISTTDAGKTFVSSVLLFPTTWKDDLASASVGVTYSTATEIHFLKTAPTGYTNTEKKLGSSDISIYTNGTKLAFVCNYQIYAPSSCTSLFYSCSKLTAIEFDNFDTSAVTSMGNMFSNCKAITELDLRNFNISNVKYMSTMFSACYKLTKISFGEFSTPYLTEVLSMFNACSNLINLDLSSFDTSNVTDMSYMFSGCSKLTSLNLSSFDTSKVTNMSCMFQQCSKLDTLNLSGFYTAKVTNMWCMFHKCLSLKYLDISNFDTSNVTNLGSMFGHCENLTNLDLSKFNTSKATNMRAMFLNCSNLINLNVSAFNTSKVTDLAYMFGSCSSLKSIDLSSFTIGASADVTNMLNFGTGNNIKKILTPKKVWKDIPITSNSVLFDTSTGDVKTSVATTDGGKIFAVKINLTVDADGGECDASTVGVYYDAPIGESGMASLPTPTKAGAEFLGWRKNYFDTVDFRDSFNTLYRTGFTKFTIADNKTLAANAGIGRYDKGTYILNDGTAFGSAVRAYWKPSESLVYGKYRISYDAYCPVLTSSTTNWSTAIDILYKVTSGSYYVFDIKNKGETPVLATTTDANGRNLRVDSTTLKHYSNEFTIDENFLGLFLAPNSAYQTYFENIKLELIETADGSDYPAEAKVSSESSFNVEQSISAIWEAVPVEVTIKVRVENNVSIVGLGSGTVSYIDATGRATSLSISGATTTVKVLQGSDLSVKVTAKTDYVFVGATKEGTTPHPTVKPSDTTEFLGISEDTTINIYIKLLSQNVLKYDENEKYFYFECGRAPQSYVGDELNERLRASDDRSILGDSFGKINGFEAIDDSGELFVYSIYDSVEGSWGDYVGIKANKTQGLLLNDEWVEVVAGEEYWFNVETIRWRVSDYGVSSTDYPEGWSDYGSINYRFNAVSDKIIWANSLTTGQYDAGAGWSAKDAFGDCADNIFGNLQIVDMYGTSNVVKANIQGNAFADAGSDNISGGASVNLVFANESTLREKFNDLRAKVTDFTAFVMGIDSNQFARYWIGDLGSKYYNVKSVGVNGNIKDAWTTNILGCRLVAYFYGGSRL